MSGCNTPPTTHTVPLYIHGDEGRGKYKLPVMVEAVQPCISFKGVSFKNSSGPLNPAQQNDFKASFNTRDPSQSPEP